jgi:hypothetical protein
LAQDAEALMCYRESRPMSGGTRKPQVRLVVRLLSGLMCLVCAWGGIQYIGENWPPDRDLAVVLLGLAVFLGYVAVTGVRRTVQAELLEAAKKYVAGQITLEEYASLTRELVKEQATSSVS